MKNHFIVVILLLSIFVTCGYADELKKPEEPKKEPFELSQEQKIAIGIFADQLIEIKSTEKELKAKVSELSKLTVKINAEMKTITRTVMVGDKKTRKIDSIKREEIEVKYCEQMASLKVIVYKLRKKLKELKGKLWNIR